MKRIQILMVGGYLFWVNYICLPAVFVSEEVESGEVEASTGRHHKALEFWLKRDIHALEDSLESGFDVHALIDTTSVKNRSGLEIRDSMSLMEVASANWWCFPESFEIVLRYANRDVIDSTSGDRVSHLLAKSSCSFFNAGRRQVPNVHFVDLYTMALDGFKVHSVNLQSETPFCILAKRVIHDDSNTLVTENRFVAALRTFYYSSRMSDWFQMSDIALVSSYKPEINGRKSNALAWIEFADLEHPAIVLKPLAPGAFDISSPTTANDWYLVDVWKKSNQLEYANFFSFYNAARREEKNTRDSISKARVVDNDNLGLGRVSFPMQAYASRHYEELTALLDCGVSPDTVLECDLFELVIEPCKFISSSSFCPKKGDNILLASALDPFSKNDTLPLILKHTDNVDARDLLNRNALHRFLYHRVQDEQKHLLKLLIDAGVDVTAKSVSGNTPCHVATNRNAHLIPEMLSAGADLYTKNDRGETPIDLLKRSISEKWIFHEQNALVLKELEDRGLLRK